MQENFETENLDIRQQKGNESNTLELNFEVADYYLETVKWGKRLSILGIAICTLMGGMAIYALGVAIFDNTKDIGAYMAMLIFVIALFIGFHLAPTYYLFNASRNIKNGIMEGDEEFAVKGFRYLKSFFKFTAISSAIVTILYFLMIIISMLFVSKRV